jgi:pimeloyl-ACP methyl ester carboxylesterase
MKPARFTRTRDGLALAWMRSGTGQPLVKAAAWLTHLEHDAQSPIWSHWVSFLEGHFDYLRYDERGCGLSDRTTGTLDEPTWTDDLFRVVEAAEIPKPFALLAMSQGAGAAVSYAARYPENVSHLILVGGYARGVHARDNPEAARLYDAIVDVFEMGWDSSNQAFRDVFTKRFVPDGDPEKIRWFGELCQRTTTPEVGAALLRARGRMDASDALAGVTCPTLILHAEGDHVVPLDEGRFLASRIPNASLVVLPSHNHILQADEPAWQMFCDEVLKFLGEDGLEPGVLLTAREREILAGICRAQSNKDIARSLGISDKTVRNQVTGIFAKLGVASRQEAILKARKM